MTPEELAEAQRDDPALEKARIIAGEAHDVSGGSGFYIPRQQPPVPTLGAEEGSRCNRIF